MKSPLDHRQADRIGMSSAPSDHACADSEITGGQAREDDIKRIDAALRRLEDGRFGLCLYCGDQISMKRLDKDPAIMSCGTCNED
ncbi:hypothetical protein D1227_03925 [Henriciella mobilis]|uniref:TraR/DksA family transcriptional regulator n=1 Tax=Henriciella mobilis TaxID=2305467 RepID=UPI000E6606DE|nr:hypothetical protein [Henriciella mobilis]RIJ17529.1 hypothetical protein D1231_04625 [Henriciella mobilis]RIJ25484.1 hypothetical protein D1227_03925 [Henriciella mobilis]